MSDRPERVLTITRHAVIQYCKRRNDKRPFQVVEDEIRDCVSTALESGYIFDRRPKGFLLYGRHSDVLPEGQRFVQCDKDANYGFIVKRHTDPAEGDVVVTTLTKAGVHR